VNRCLFYILASNVCVACLIFCVLAIFFTYKPDIDVRKEVRLVKEDYSESYLMETKERVRLSKALDRSFRMPLNPFQLSPEYVLIHFSQDGRKHRLFIHRTARIGWDEKGRAFSLSGSLCRLLDNGIINLENIISERYGELVPWAKAEKIFRIYDKAMITDVETRKSFWVQRRAGTNHADVQPLTARDSHIMKSIYKGKWSWERRAIIVVVRGRRMAASMNGMPHGAGAIKDNDFPGHFCIHFFGSKTHAGNRVDPKHQAMVLKAAGRTKP